MLGLIVYYCLVVSKKDNVYEQKAYQKMLRISYDSI